MGVSGSGKTTIGKKLSEELDVPFYDADDFHPKNNVEKMSKGIPLTDEDRWPWLNNLKDQLNIWKKSGGAVLACSALKHAYRKILDSADNHIFWVYLEGSKSIILKRMEARKGHYMPPSLLDSQFKTLEIPSKAIKVNIEKTPTEIVNYIIKILYKHES